MVAERSRGRQVGLEETFLISYRVFVTAQVTMHISHIYIMIYSMYHVYDMFYDYIILYTYAAYMLIYARCNIFSVFVVCK